METEALSSATKVSGSRNEWKHVMISLGWQEQSWRQSAQ